MYIMRQRVSYDLNFLATDLQGNIIGTLKGNAHYFTINISFALHKSCVLEQYFNGRIQKIKRRYINSLIEYRNSLNEWRC